MLKQLMVSPRRLVSATLVAWMGIIALGPFIHHDLGHDEDCAPAVVLHDESKHHFAAAPFAPLQAEHCAVCHLFCGSRYTGTAVVSVVTTVRQAPAVPIEDDERLTGSTARPLPARAPPARS